MNYSIDHKDNNMEKIIKYKCLSCRAIQFGPPVEYELKCLICGSSNVSTMQSIKDVKKENIKDSDLAQGEEDLNFINFNWNRSLDECHTCKKGPFLLRAVRKQNEQKYLSQVFIYGQTFFHFDATKEFDSIKLARNNLEVWVTEFVKSFFIERD